jgi:hypothetical protein
METNVCWENHKNTKHLALLQCNLLDWDWKAQNKKKFAKSLGTFIHDPNFNIVSYCALEKFMRRNKVVINYSYHIDPLQYIHIYV